MAEPGRPLTRARVGVITPVPLTVWRAAYDADPGARPTQLPEWRDSIVAHGRWRDASRLYEFPRSRLVVLPLVAKSVGPFRLAVASWPDGWGIGGPLAAGGVTEAELAAIRSDLAHLRVASTRLLVAGNVAASSAEDLTTRLIQVLSLEGGFDHVKATRFSANTRKLIGRGQRSGLQVSRGNGPDQLAAFTRVYDLSARRWARARRQAAAVSRVLSRLRDHSGQVAAVIDRFGEGCELWVARLDGVPVACNVVLHDGTRSVAWMSASDLQRVGKSYAQHLLHSMIAEDACSRGAVELDLGESDPGSGVEAWKAHFGAEHRPISELRTERLPLAGAEALARRLVNRRAENGVR